MDVILVCEVCSFAQVFLAEAAMSETRTLGVFGPVPPWFEDDVYVTLWEYLEWWHNVGGLSNFKRFKSPQGSMAHMAALRAAPRGVVWGGDVLALSREIAPGYVGASGYTRGSTSTSG